MNRLEFHYTPKHASWLNMAEIELSILSKQCLSRRIPIDVHKNWLRYVTLRERSLRPKSLVFWRRDPSLRSGRH